MFYCFFLCSRLSIECLFLYYCYGIIRLDGYFIIELRIRDNLCCFLFYLECENRKYLLYIYL